MASETFYCTYNAQDNKKTKKDNKNRPNIKKLNQILQEYGVAALESISYLNKNIFNHKIFNGFSSNGLLSNVTINKETKRKSKMGYYAKKFDQKCSTFV